MGTMRAKPRSSVVASWLITSGMPARAPIVTSRPHGSVWPSPWRRRWAGRHASSITLTESPSFIGGRRARRTSPRSFSTPATRPGAGTVRDTCSGAPRPFGGAKLARGQARDLERPVLARAHRRGGGRRQDGGHAREPHRAVGVHHAALERRHAEAEVHAAHGIPFVRRRVLLGVGGAAAARGEVGGPGDAGRRVRRGDTVAALGAAADQPALPPGRGTRRPGGPREGVAGSLRIFVGSGRERSCGFVLRPRHDGARRVAVEVSPRGRRASRSRYPSASIRCSGASARRRTSSGSSMRGSRSRRAT